MKLLLTDTASLCLNENLNLDIFNQFGEVKMYDEISREELLEEAKTAEAIICNKVEIDSEVINNAPNLKYIGLFATGYNNVDIACAKENNIAVCNAGSYSTNAVAQQVMAYILLHYTKLLDYDSFVKMGGWVNSVVFSPLVFASDELYGKTIGIIGYGSIGKAVEKAALGFGMNVLVNTRTSPNDDPKFVDLDILLNKSDIITVHCPLTDKTKDLINKDTIGKMKDGAFFVNTSRGGTVDEQALADALKTGKLSGAGIDVLKEEPMSPDCPLISAPNLIITPHTAWGPISTRKRVINIAAENLKAFLNGEKQNRIV